MIGWLRPFGPTPALTANHKARLAAWKALPAPDPEAPLSHGRLVVLDVETSGLNPARDRLIAIGAVGLRSGKIDLRDSLALVLRQEQASDRDNIVLHGIGGSAQAAGTPQAEALLRFLEFLGKAPLIAFHAAFDETAIKRALKRRLGLVFDHPWLDLACIAPAVLPELAKRRRSLDDWTGHFGIPNFSRHNALADAFATAQLFLALAPAMAKNALGSYGKLQAAERAHRWLGREH